MVFDAPGGRNFAIILYNSVQNWLSLSLNRLILTSNFNN